MQTTGRRWYSLIMNDAPSTKSLSEQTCSAIDRAHALINMAMGELVSAQNIQREMPVSQRLRPIAEKDLEKVIRRLEKSLDQIPSSNEWLE